LFGANQSGLIDLFCLMNRFAWTNTYLREEEGTAMRKHRIFRIVALVGLIATVAGGNSAAAQEHRGTLQQQMACTSDVFRLCGAAIPDENRIVACLQANTPQLSAPCRAIFDSSADASPPNGPPQSSPQPPAPKTPWFQ
jgi:hypothetical protein